MNITENIKSIALSELAKEERDRLVIIEKEKILTQRRKPKFLFPWRIRIINLNKE